MNSVPKSSRGHTCVIRMTLNSRYRSSGLSILAKHILFDHKNLNLVENGIICPKANCGFGFSNMEKLQFTDRVNSQSHLGFVILSGFFFKFPGLLFWKLESTLFTEKLFFQFTIELL